MCLDHRSKEIRLHWSVAICSHTISSWNNIPALLHSCRTSALNSLLHHFHQLSVWLSREPDWAQGRGHPVWQGCPGASLAMSPLGSYFAGWKGVPTEGVIKLEKRYFLLLAFFFSLAAFFIKRRPGGFLIIFKTFPKHQSLYSLWWWRHNQIAQDCGGDRQL